MALRISLQDLYEGSVRRALNGKHGSDGQLTDLPLVGLHGHRCRMLNVSQDQSGLLGKHLPGPREFHLSLGSLKELHPQFLLELEDLLAERRLTDIQPF